MPGPARSGLFLYAKDLHRLARFYAAVAELQQVTDTPEMVVLASPDLQLIVHAIPPMIAATIEIATPPVRREDTALKFFLTVASLATARTTAAEHGGEVGHENWRGPGFTVCNAVDPEGNVFQLREFAS
jgi:predicted enzyme related to lactoylglutathione lyase